MRIVLLGLLLFSTTPFANEYPALHSLEQLAWQHRIIVIFSAQKSSISTLKQNSEQISERHIIWLVLEEGIISSNYPGAVFPALRDQLLKHYAKPKKRVVLIGKDGGVKHRSDKLDLPYLYSLIDVMPMRMREMQDGEI